MSKQQNELGQLSNYDWDSLPAFFGHLTAHQTTSCIEGGAPKPPKSISLF